VVGAPIGRRRDRDLGDDLTGGKVAIEPEQPGLAERAAPGAADLGRDAQARAAAAHRQVHALDGAAIAEPQFALLHRARGRRLGLGRRGPRERECRELAPGAGRAGSEAVPFGLEPRPGRRVAVQPIGDVRALLGPETGLGRPQQGGSRGGEQIEGELGGHDGFRTRVDGSDVPIVKDVSFELAPGEFATIMGPSGSGKSTLLHMLAGLEPPSAGAITLAGHDLGAADEEARAAVRRRHIGFIFQFFHLLPDLTVWENVTLPLRILGQSPKKHSGRIESLLELLGIAQLKDRRPAAMSGGEMQRVSIARALSTQPPLILADEPTGNLSSKAGEEVVQLLGRVREKLATAILLVTHNPRDAAVGDRVMEARSVSLTSIIVCKSWASSPLRMALTVLGIALGVAIVVAIYVMDHNTIQSRLLAQNPQRGRVDLEVRAKDTNADREAVRRALSGHAGVDSVAVWGEARGLVLAQGGDRSLDVAVFGLDPLPAGPFAHYVVHHGRDLGVDDMGPEGAGVLLGAEAARLLGVEAGSTVTLAAPARIQRVECRDGKLVPLPMPPGKPFETEVTVAGIVGDERLGGRNFGQMVVCSLGLAQRLQPRGPAVYHVLRAPGTDLDRLTNDLEEEFNVQDMRGALIGEGADERAFRNGLKILGGLALLLGMYVVFQTLSHALVARIKQLGLLRCLGAGSGAITRIFLVDALLLGALGSVTGIGLGLLFAYLLREYEVSSLGLGKAWATFEIPWYPVGWTALLGMLFTLAGAMFPLVRARKVPALQILQARAIAPGKDDGVDLLRGINFWMFGLLAIALPLAYLAMTPLASEEGTETLVVLIELVSMLGLFGGVLLLAPGIVAIFGRLVLLPFRAFSPMAAWLVDKVVQRSAGRVAAAVCGLSAVVIAMLGLKALTMSLRAEVRNFDDQALAGRMFLRTHPVSPDAARGLAEVPGVLAVEAFEGEQRGDGFQLRGLATAAIGNDGAPLEGLPALLARYDSDRARSCVISSRLSRHKGKRAGSTINLIDRNGTHVAYQVLAVSDRAGFDSDERAWVLTNPRWMKRDFCVADECVEHITLRLDPGADTDAITAAARAMFPAVPMSKRGDSIGAYLLRDVDRDFVLFDVLLLLMLALAGVGLLNGMTIAALGRVRELGVLRALGITRRALGGSFLLEGAVVAVLAA
ncbi:macB, partial [Symbiodinium sp. KB8]